MKESIGVSLLMNILTSFLFFSIAFIVFLFSKLPFAFKYSTSLKLKTDKVYKRMENGIGNAFVLILL